MHNYLVTCVTGLESVVERELRETITDLKVKRSEGGMVVFETSAKPSTIRKFRFINNAFIVLKSYPQSNVNHLLEQLRYDFKLSEEYRRWFEFVPKRYRIVVSKANEMIRPDGQRRDQLELTIQKQTKLQMNAARPDIEFWLIIRNEGGAYWTLRLNTHRPQPQRGEIRHELAHLLAILGDVQPTHVVLDPFAGYGAIPYEIARYFKVKQVIANDIESREMRKLQLTANHEKLPMKTMVTDALAMPLDNESIDRIVTDPPWGMYRSIAGNETDFYRQFLDEASRVLKPFGVLVALCGAKEQFEQDIDLQDALQFRQKYDVLVSGKKAGVYILQKET